MLLYGGVMFIIATLFFTSEISGNNSGDEINYRLPNSVVPLHYNVHLIPYPYFEDVKNNFHYTGTCYITIFILYSTWNITIHLQTTVSIFTAEFDNYFVATHLPSATQNITEDTIVFHFLDQLGPGIYTVKIIFDGFTIHNKRVFYRTFFENTENKTEIATVTNFQRIGARQVFPCWDEPAMKATFTLIVTHFSEYTVWSNMLKKRTQVIVNWKWTIFHVTPPTSPHRIGLILTAESFTNFAERSNKSVVQYRQTKTKDLTFTIMIIEKVKQYMQHRLKIKEVLQNISHIVIPGILDNIQNSGLICYNEADVIYNNTLDSPGRDREVAYLVARQVASQWFSNLVSPSWWSDEWVNKGLEMFYGIDAINELFPHYHIMDLFVVQNRDLLNLDPYIMTLPPFISEINSPSDINSLSFFPYYLKASIFFRMLKHIIIAKQAQVFLQGIQLYLNTYKFGSANSDDFWTAMQTTLNKTNYVRKFDLKKRLQNYMWYHISIVLDVNRNYKTGYTKVSFMPENLNNQTLLTKREFMIPVTYTIQNSAKFNITSTNIMWLNVYTYDKKRVSLNFNSYNINGWLILNLQQIGYYRVNYDLTNWKKIVKFLNTKKYTEIHVLNRAQIVDDVFNLMLHQRVRGNIFLQVLKYLSQETDFVAWYPMFKAFEYLSYSFPLSQTKKMKKKIRQTLNSVIKKIGYNDPTNNHSNNSDNPFYDSRIILRHEIMRWICVLNDAKCKKMAHKKLQQYLAAGESLNNSMIWPVPGLMEWTFCYGVMTVKDNDWYTLLDRWKHLPEKLFKFLACSENMHIITTYLHIIALSKTHFDEPNDRIHIFYFIIARHITNKQVFQFVLKNFKTTIPKEIKRTAALIIIINHLYNIKQLWMVNRMVRRNFPRLSENIYDKITKRITCLIKFEFKIEKIDLISNQIDD
ncbi:glutamyl aminopeptidase-like isoform X2 [Linepithema humile]